MFDIKEKTIPAHFYHIPIPPDSPNYSVSLPSQENFSNLVSFIQDKQLYNTLSPAQQQSQDVCQKSTNSICLEESHKHNFWVWSQLIIL